MPRAIVGDIAIDNQTPYPDAQLLRRSKISNKVEMTAARLSRGSDRLRKFLVNQGYLGASALITVQTYDPQSNRVPLKFTVETGPRVQHRDFGRALEQGQAAETAPDFCRRRGGR